jgi:prevent-host-death family protein
MTRGHVLLVEDEPALRKSLRRQLGNAGFETTPASDGAEALQLLKAQNFDVVVCDLVMPELDGLSFLRRVHELSAELPVILMCEKSHRRSARRAKAEGALDLLIKPIDVSSLERTLANAIRRHRGPVMFRNRRGEELRVASFNATVAKNSFGRMLDTALQEGAIVITKHDDPKAVLLSWDEFQALNAARSRQLAELTGEFDALYKGMQTAHARAAMQSAFDATPAELDRAAMRVAGKRG